MELFKEERSSKCFLSQGLLPKYAEAKQPPTKGQPFSTVLSSRFLHKIELVLPKKLYLSAWPNISENVKPIKYSRVILKLSDVLSGDFFNVYVKAGNIALLSEGRSGVDPIFSLIEGRLRLELPKQLYERAGLVGQAINDNGRKHIKTRFAVEFDLRHSSMVHGRKGFERLVWASKNVLTQSLNWLFVDLQGDGHRVDSAVSKHHPFNKTAEPAISHSTVKAPGISMLESSETVELGEDSIAFLEWLDLLSVDSPRIQSNDSIDSFLSRYAIPDKEKATEEELVRVVWSGFIPSIWARDLLLQNLNAAMKLSKTWFSLTGYRFGGLSQDGKLGWTVVRFPNHLHPVVRLEKDEDEPMEDDSTRSSTQASQKQTDRASAPRYLLFEMTSK